MKFRRLLALLTVVLLILGVFAGCGAKSSNDSYSNGAMYPASDLKTEDHALYDEAPEAQNTSNSMSSLPENQKWIRTIYLNAETEDLTPLLENIRQKVTQLGGYLESQEVYNGSNYNNYRHRNASLTIRIPVSEADNFITQVSEASNIVSSNEDLENITLTYVATESRITALETEQKRLLELMENAESMSDLLEIEARLTDVRYELENMTSQLRVYDNLVDFATIHLSVEEVQVLTPVEEETLWQEISRGFMESIRGVGEFLLDLVVWFVTKLPYLILIGIIIAVVLSVLKFVRKRPRKAKKEAKPIETTPPEKPAE